MDFKLFGDWRKPNSPEMTERGKLLLGFFDGTAEPTQELLAVMREEWSAQERYRTKLHAGLVRACRALADAAEQNIAELDIARGTDEQYAIGYHSGLYRGYADSAQVIGGIEAEASAASEPEGSKPKAEVAA
jgi:hypothetical protein